MLVSKVKPQIFQKPNLTVDAWKLQHGKNGDMKEEFVGKVKMVEEEKLLYLGFMLSKNGDIMQNINHRRNNSIGTGKKIIRLIEPLGSTGL